VFRTQGIPLGAIRGGAIGKTLSDQSVHLGPGDLLLQYTDGVNEAFEPSGVEQFGFERLERAVLEAAPHGAATVLTSVHRAIEDWVGDGPALDDETMLVVAHEGAAAGSPSERRTPVLDPLALLGEARARGRCIEFAAREQELAAGLRPWLEQCPTVGELERGEFEVLSTALHEACANVVEHGYQGDASCRLELWFVPAPGSGADSRLRGGYFVIRDQGGAFNADHWQATDFSNRETWKRGRGIGLDIIHRGMSLVAYHPGTREGNITVMTFDPGHLQQILKEKRHA
jgi:anti-sigma regulatory factor (Ser/Thr protein kinase)